MHQRRARSTNVAWGPFALALAALGCPQMLADDFGTPSPDLRLDDGSNESGSAAEAGAKAMPVGEDAGGSSGAGGAAGAAGSASAGAAGSNTAGSSGAGNAGSAGSGGAPASDAGSGADTDSGAPSCAASAELCDGVDNDCDDQIDQADTCATECRGLMILGRSYMYCGGAGENATVAETRCEQQGMQLASVESSDENAAILSAVAPLHSTLSTVVEDQPSIWMSAQDIAVENTWRWGAGGPIFWLGLGAGSAQNGAYVNWSTGKPNNNASGTGEDCGVLYVGAGSDGLGQWNDLACDTVHAFLCEQSAP